MKKGLIGRMKAAAGRIREFTGKVLHGTPQETAEERKMRTYGLRGIAIAAVAVCIALGSVVAVNAATTYYARYYTLGGTLTYYDYSVTKIKTTTSYLSFSSTTTSSVWLPFYYEGTLTANNFHAWSSGKDRIGLTSNCGLVDISYSGHAFLGWYVCQGTSYGNKYQLSAASAYSYATAVANNLEDAGGYSTVYDVGYSGMVATADNTVATRLALPSNNDYSDSTLTVEGFTMGKSTAYGYGTGKYLSIYPIFAGNSSGTPYAVTYNLNGGSYSGNPSYSTSSRSSTTASVVQRTFFVNIPGTILSFTPTKTGYTFKGWATSSSATSAAYTSGDSITLTASKTLYAVWTAKSQKVTFDDQNDDDNTTRTLKYDSSSYYSLTAPTKTGYTFKGYNTASDGSGTYVWLASGKGNTSSSYWSSSGTWANNSTSAMTVYAIWEANTYTVTFHKNGGSGTDKQTQTFTYGTQKALTKVSTLGYSMTGSSFTGWATSSSGTVKYADGAKVKNLTSTSGGNIDLYAIWGANTFIIVYDGNGSTSGSMENTTVTYGEPTALSANEFKRTGYTFAGWYAYRGIDGKYRYKSTDGSTNSSGNTTGWYEEGDEPDGWTYYIYKDGASVSATATSGVVTMYATWEANEITVVYHANGGSGTMADSTFTYGVTTQLSANEFTRTGYTFVGWYCYREVDGKYRFKSTDGTTSSSGATTGWYKTADNCPGKWAYYVYKDKNNVSATATSGTIHMYALWSKDGAGWTMSDVIQDANMFYHAYDIEGGEGTTYDGNYTDSKRAQVDGGTEDPGYFTQDPYQ